DHDRLLEVTAAARVVRGGIASNEMSGSPLYLMAEAANRSSKPRLSSGGDVLLIATRAEMSGDLVWLDGLIETCERAFGAPSSEMVRHLLCEKPPKTKASFDTGNRHASTWAN